VDFKKFGIGLAFTPTVLGEGQINLKIEPEVSDIDPTRTFTYGGGITVPGLIVRRANVTIELRDGQSFAIAGLLDNKHNTDQAQLPWVGQIPVLGTLFRSASFQKNETDLVIIVTPHLVKPAVPGEKLETPLEQRVPGNDIDFFLMGRAERDPRERDRAEYGHILEVQGPWAATIVPEGIK
jgi:pilus assembly protein CpaC